MLTIEQIRRIAHQTGARDIDKVETDVILTYLLQLFHDKGITEQTNLLRKDQRPDLKDMIHRVVEGFRFLGQMTDLERKLALDNARRCRAEIDALKAEAVTRASEAS